jgi:uncharacterized OB-fold protein
MRTELNSPYWDALEAGALVFQRCANGHGWLPARIHCPRCLSDLHEWVPASGRAQLISWVVYRRAYHPAFADRVPYNVALVQLEEGPQLMTNVVGLSQAAPLVAGMPLRLEVEREGELSVARFAPLTAGGEA